MAEPGVRREITMAALAITGPDEEVQQSPEKLMGIRCESDDVGNTKRGYDRRKEEETSKGSKVDQEKWASRTGPSKAPNTKGQVAKEVGPGLQPSFNDSQSHIVEIGMGQPKRKTTEE